MSPRKDSSESPHAAEPAPVASSSDPRAIRALAHPVRLSLLELLGHAGTLTATQASEVLGESPANCAFHLRTLAKYGFVEEAGGGRGRERPWRRVQGTIRIADTKGDPEYTAAASALGDALLPALTRRAMDTITRHDLWPEAWRKDVLSQGVSILYLTPGEAREIAAEMRTLTARHHERGDHPELRPAAAIPVEFLTFAYPLLHLLGVRPGSTEDEEVR
ncbi:MAG TPA: helix-turn-helix domain-containing protein [Streptosporangiaceae bacterium]|jgi:DNA-binding transcriptional ArsR family regulator